MAVSHKSGRDVAESPITRLMSVLGALVAVLFAVTLPAVYYVISMHETRHALTVDTAFVAGDIERIVQARPDMWEFESVRLQEIMARPAYDGHVDARVIRNASGEIVVQADVHVPSPGIAVMVPFYESGRAIGTVEASHSVRTEVVTTVAVAMVSSLLGLLIYVVFRIYPIRKLKSTLLDLHAERDKLELLAVDLERVNAELRTSEKRFEDVVVNAGEWIWEVDVDGRFTYSSPDVTPVLGYTPAEILGRHLLDVVHPDGRKEAAEAFERVIVRREPVHNVVNTGVHKNGYDVILESSGLPVVAPDGKLVGCRAVSRDITARVRAERMLRDSHDQLTRQQEILVSLTRSEFFAGGDLTQVVQRLLETDSKHAGIARVSLWRFTDDRSAIRCVDLYEHKENRHSSGVELKAADFPGYFSILNKGATIIADDAHCHPATREFSACYLTPLGITSMLDVPLVLNGRLEGVICHEHVGPPISWTPEQQYFAVVLSHLIALAVEHYERKLTEQALRVSEQKFQSLFESSHDAIMTIESPSWKFASANPATLKLFGVKSVEEFLSYGPWDMSPALQPDGRPSGEKAGEMIEAAIRNGSMFFEWTHRRMDGTEFAADVLLTRTQQGEKTIIQATVRDITERKRSEHALTLFRTLLDRSTDAIEVTDLKTGRFLDVNEKACTDIGYSRERLLAMRIPDIDPNMTPEIYANTTDALTKAGSLRFESTHVRKDGVTFPVEINLTHVKLDRDYMVAVVRDITERKRAAQALAESEERLRTIFNSMTDGLLIADLEDERKRFCVCNPMICRMLGYTPEEMTALGLADIHPEKDHASVKAQFEKQAKGELVTAVELPVKRKDGSVFYADVSAVTIPLAGKQCLVGLFRDATERRRAQERLRRFAAELEQANEDVKQFAYIVSHDLRAPLVNLKGFSAEVKSSLGELASKLDVAQPRLNPDEAETIRKIVREDIPDSLSFIDSSATQMDRLVTSLLTLSRLGRAELHFETLDMDMLVGNALKSLAHQMGAVGAQATVGPLPRLMADRTAMERVFSNILTNAVNYLEPGRPGRIDISGERTDSDTTFVIRDNGRGIAQEDMPKVFAPFRRAGKQNVPGEGIGLAYVQTLVRRHGGQIRCESEVGVGTTFTLVIPNHIDTGENHVQPSVS